MFDTKRQQTTIAFATFAVLTAALLVLSLGCEKAEQDQAPDPAMGQQQAPDQPPPSAQEQPGQRAEAPSAGAQDDRPAPGGERAEAPSEQPDRPDPRAAAAGADDGEISEEVLENYVEVQPEVQKVQRDLQQKMNSVEQPSEARDLQQEAREKISKTLASSGLSSQDYLKIETKMREDPEFRSKLEEKIQSSN